MDYINGYKFLTQVPVFSMDKYQIYQQVEDSQNKPFKIYSRPQTNVLYLHDEAQDKMFAFMTDRYVSQVDLGQVVLAYLLSYPQNQKQ